MIGGASGSPVGPFKQYVSAVPAGGGATTALIAAPGAGLSLYIQTITVTNSSLLAGQTSDANFQDTAANIFADVAIAGPTQIYSWVTFPGGLEIVTNRGVSVVLGGAVARISITYTTGPSL